MATVAPVDEGSEEEERQVKGLYESMQPLMEGIDDVIVCKAVAVFMGTLMAKSEQWPKVIGGFMNHITVVANTALLLHKQQELEDATKEEGSSADAQPDQPIPPEAKG